MRMDVIGCVHVRCWRRNGTGEGGSVGRCMKNEWVVMFGVCCCVHRWQQ